MSSYLRWNVWTCNTCSAKHYMTENIEGTTPMMILCRSNKECVGWAFSAGYPKEKMPKGVYVIGEWIKPGPKEYATLGRNEKRHVDQGGLIPRWNS